MSSDNDLDRRLIDWFDDEAPRRAPHSVVRGVRLRIDRLPQSSIPWTWTPHWPTAWTARLAVAAIAVLAVVSATFLAGNLLNGIGRPVPGSSPSPTPSASAPTSLCVDTQQVTLLDRVPGTGSVSGAAASGRILFTIANQGGGPSGTMALVYIDSTGLHQLPGSIDWTAAHAIWESPTSILFDSERNGDRHLFRMAVGDGTITQLTDGQFIGQQTAAVLGDGRIVHSVQDCLVPKDLGLAITSADGTTNSSLTPSRNLGDPGWDDQPTVSPDGTSIVFVRHADDNSGALFRIEASGGIATRLTPDLTNVSYPRWSPDGNTILFSQSVSGDTDLWTVAATGGTLSRLTTSPSGQGRFEGDWSPDGRLIVFKEYQSGSDYNELHVINADGSSEHTAWVGDHSDANQPDWGP